MYTAFVQVAILAVLVAIGFACDRKKLFTEKASRLSNDLLFYIVTPAIICKAFLSVEKSPETLKRLGIAFACGILINILGIAIATPIFHKLGKENSAIFKFASIYGNVGYMALPLADAILGEEGVFFCSAIVVAFNIFCFTHGVFIMSAGNEKKKFDYKKILVNPGTISIIIGLPLFLFNIKLPAIIGTPIQHLANLNTPLAMLMFGTYLSNSDLKTMFKEKCAYISAGLKLILIPIAVILTARLMGVKDNSLVALAISASAPTANATIMFAAKYNKDTGVASKTASLTSIFSIITIPAIIAFAKLL